MLLTVKWGFRSTIVLLIAILGTCFGQQAKAQLDRQYQNNQDANNNKKLVYEESKKIICASAQFQDVNVDPNDNQSLPQRLTLLLVADGGYIWSAYNSPWHLCSPFCPPSGWTTDPLYLGQLDRQRTGTDGRQELWKVEGSNLVLYRGGFTNVDRTVYYPRNYRHGRMGRHHPSECD